MLCKNATRGFLSLLATAVGGAILVQAATSFALTQILSTSAQRLIADMRVRVQEHIGRLPIRYYDANKTGALVSRIMSDVEGVRNLVSTLVEFIGGIFTAVIAFVLLLRISATLTLVAIGFMAVFRRNSSKGIPTSVRSFANAGKSTRK